MNKRICLSIVTMLLCLTVVVVNPLTVEASYGTITQYTPNVLVGYKDTHLTLNNTYIGLYKQNSESIESDYINATYEGTLYLYPEIIMDSNCYYNGYFSFDLVLSSNQTSNLYFNATCNMDDIDGIHCRMELRENTENNSTFRFTFEFNEFYCNNSYMRFPLKVDVSTTLIWDASLTDIPPQIICSMYSGNVNSSMYKFTDLRDMNTTDGTFANQNQQIIDGIDENTGALEDLNNNIGSWFSDLKTNLSSWFADQKSNINTRFSELTSNLSSWFSDLTSTINSRFDELLNQNSEEHEETINGYDDKQGVEINTELNDSLTSIENTESSIKDSAFSGVNEYTIPEGGVASYATQFLTVFPLVASMLTSIYVSSKSFSIIISVMFTVLIVSMLAGLFRYYKDG